MSVKKRDNLSISTWIGRFSGLIRGSGCVLDLAAGGGRHSRWLLDQGYEVTALDRETGDLQALAHEKSAHADPQQNAHLEIVKADLEDGSPWPLAKRRFDAVVVTNYLWRPLFPSILNALDAGGILLYETFAVGQEALGKPSHPDFLLRPGELLDVVVGHLTVIAYEHGRIEGQAGPAIKQRIAAIRGDGVVKLPPP
jgi:SAM-dependent methyltransferase